VLRKVAKTVPSGPAAQKSPTRQSVAISTFVVMGGSAFSTLLGFGLQIVTAHLYGTTAELDAFLNASTVPTILFGALNVAIVSALVPTFTDYMSQGRPEDVRRLGSTTINLLFFIMTGLAGLGWLLAPIFVPIIAHGFPVQEQQLDARMVRWLMPGIVASSISGVCVALLNANHRFASSALVQAAASATTIVVAVAFHRSLGIFALVLGSVLGLFAQLIVQIPSILRYRLYRLELDLHHKGLLRILVLLVPVLIGSGATQINLAFDRYFASTLSSGSTSALNYATKLAFLPMAIIAGALGTVVFPLIAGQFSSSNHAGIRRSLSLSLRMISFIVIPSAVGLSILAYPIVQTLFQRGAFGPAATEQCASLIPFACVPLIAMSYNSVLGRACYACKAGRLLLIGSAVAVILNIVLSATWLPFIGARGLLLANAAAGAFGIVFQVALLWRLADGFEWRPILSSLARIALASVIMACALLPFRSIAFLATASYASRALHLAALLLVGIIVYMIGAWLLRVKELTITVGSVRTKFTPRTTRDTAAELADAR